MDKVEYKLRSDEIKKLIQQKDFAQAAEIADTIDWRRVKSVMMLCTISDVYKMNRRYENAKDLLLLAYDRRPGGRSIVYSLCELCLRTGDLVQAMEYYKEFVNVAPKDPGRYILQYKIYEDQDVSLEERIEVLEELKKHDYREKWAYELAYLYHRVGLATRCVEECDEMIACFGDGEYVVKAMELKMLHQPLTAEQQRVYDHRFDPKQEEEEFLDEEEVLDEEDDERSTGHDENAEERYSALDDGQAEEHTAVWKKEDVQVNMVTGDTIVYEPVRAEDLAEYDLRDTETNEEEPEEPEVPEESIDYADIEPSVEIPERIEEEEPDIFVKTMDVGQYNTINLQAALAQELKPYLDDGDDEYESESMEPEVVEPEISESQVEETPKETVIEEESEDIFDEEPIMVSEPDEVEKSEVFFGETGEINVNRPVSQANSYEKKMAEIEPPRAMADVLSQESDGQLRIVLPQGQAVEKQITGQMDIEDVLAEWERMKRENEEKRKAEVRRHVLQQTGSMFTEFEAAVRDGLLEKLEKDDSSNAVLPNQDADDIFVDQPADDIFADEPADDIFADQPVDDIFADQPTDGIFREADSEKTTEDFEDLEEAEEIEEIEEIKEIEDTEAIEDALEEQTEESEEAVDPVETAESEEEAESERDVEEGTVKVTPDEQAEESEEDVESEENAEETEEEPAEDSEEPEEESGDEQEAEEVKEKVRSMTREEREHFSSYIQSRQTREQIVKAIDDISLAAYTGNVIISGEVDVDTIPLAKKIIREIQSNDSNFSGQVAKISGNGLNQKNMDETIDRLQNGALIVQKASTMNEQTVTNLHKALQREDLGIVVVLQDDTKSMDQFLEQYDFLKGEFTSRIDVKALSNDMLVAYGKQYAREQEYAIDDLGVLALHNRIEKRQTIDHAVTMAEVREIVDEAISHARRISLGHFVGVLVGKRYDDEDMIIVSEKDFL